MKTLATLVLFAAFTGNSFAVDPVAPILAEYREKSAAALQRIDKALEQEANNLASALLRDGDSKGGEAIQQQAKMKEAGDPVPAPHKVAASLFAKYDAARAIALEPVQKVSISRIDAMLKMAGGQKPEVVTALAKARTEITSGKVSDPVATKWSYHASLDAPPIASMELAPDGAFTLNVKANGKKEIGTWKPSEKTNTLILSYGGSSWEMHVDGRKASMNRPDSGMRYLKAVGTTTL